MPHFSIPIMFDVTADTRDEAVRQLVALLGSAQITGGACESWWTLAAEDKAIDGNDNAAGTITFQ